MYLLDRDNLGGMAQGPGEPTPSWTKPVRTAECGESPRFSGPATAATFTSSRATGTFARSSSCRALRAGQPRLRRDLRRHVRVQLRFAGGDLPGTDGSSALVWVVYVSGGTGADAELRAYRAIPDNTGNLKEVFSAPLGIGSKFSSVATDKGRVYVGTRDGHVLGFGAPTTSAVGAKNTDLGTAKVGTTVTGSVTITASRAVTVSSITTRAPFKIGTRLTMPRELAKGASMTVPVIFAPTVPGQADGTLTVKTADGETDLLGVHGVGTKEGLGATPP